jgi:protein-S-isoprenylcysteine O-methyltransferase Ste14
MNKLELKLPPVALTLIMGTMMWTSSELLPATKYTNSWSITIALIALCIGVFFAVMGVIEFKKAKTTVDPRVPHQTSSLVITGVYKLSRNPMYIGFLFILLSWAFYLSQIYVFLFLLLFVVYMNKFQITPEERFMTQKFGEDYILYMTKVRRWI